MRLPIEGKLVKVYLDMKRVVARCRGNNEFNNEYYLLALKGVTYRFSPCPETKAISSGPAD